MADEQVQGIRKPAHNSCRQRQRRQRQYPRGCSQTHSSCRHDKAEAVDMESDYTQYLHGWRSGCMDGRAGVRLLHIEHLSDHAR